MTRPLAKTALALALLLSAPALTTGETSETPWGGPGSTPIVLAYVDSGINPYHYAFREPAWTAHPSTYIPGYPPDAIPLHLSLDAATYEEAIEQDQHIWDNVQAETLYYVPGTRIIGMISSMDWNGPFPLLDESGHGTAVIDAGSGQFNGMAPRSAIVSVGSAGSFGRPWIVDQPWIDMVSESIGCVAPMLGGWQATIPVTNHHVDWTWSPAQASYRIHTQGRLHFNSAGNGFSGTNAWCDHKPPWKVIVGNTNNWRESDQTYDRHIQTDPPFEIGAEGGGHYAEHDSLNGTRLTGGTSISSPKAMGYAALLVERARSQLGHEGGFANGLYATAAPAMEHPSSGPLMDGELTADEIRRLLYDSARPARVFLTGVFGTPSVVPPEEIAYLHAGYGGIGPETLEHAMQLLLGEGTPEPKPYHDYWHNQIKSAQWEVWRFLVCKAHYEPVDYGQCADDAGNHLDPLAPLPLE